MNVVGIIAEYNPFHEGHAYQIQKAKEQCGAEFAVVVMNGDFVQRGDRLTRLYHTFRNRGNF